MRVLFGYITLLLVLGVSLAAQDDTKSALFASFRFGPFGRILTWDATSGLPTDENNPSINAADVGWEMIRTFHINKQFGIAAHSSSSYGRPTDSERTSWAGKTPKRIRSPAWVADVWQTLE